MKTLLAPTEDFIKRERGRLTADAIAGSTVQITVVNTEGLANNDFVVLGIEGSENAELVQIANVTNTTYTATLLKLNHKADEPFTKYRYNKRKFYGSLTETGAYTEIITSGSPALISVDDPQGTFIEYIGVEGYTYFKSTYFNSATSDETSLTDSFAVLADESTRYCSIYAIQKQAGLTNNPYITAGMIEIYRKRAENEVDSYLSAKYTLPLVNSSGTTEIPWMIENMTVLLAAGYMDYQEFGKDGQGVKWLGEARSILKKLQTGEVKLMGSNKQIMGQLTLTIGVQGFPDQVDNANGPYQKFNMGQTF